jgi:exopolysaccharide biosynthesis WecB/TagA/CpsF family protein
MFILNSILTVLAVALLVPAGVFCGQCLLALLPRRKSRREIGRWRQRVAVIMPAHNEAAVIAASIAAVAEQLVEGDRLIVIADNCSDDTAAVARETGATVIERHDTERRGKGYALDFGVRYLEKDAPEVVIVMDADCVAGPGMIAALGEQVAATDRPAQAIYLMEHPRQPSVRDLVSALAFQVKNEVRPCGMHRLGLPCLLTGTGMAFPWPDIRDAKLATGNIVEDMQLGVELTLNRRAALLCPAARVTGRLPESEAAVLTQRRRWEHGHLHTLTTQVPRLLLATLKGNFAATAIALDLAVPPLSLLVASLVAAMMMTSALILFGATASPAIALPTGVAAIASCVMLSWATSARRALPLRTLLAAPVYLLWKLPIYATFLVRRERRWQRTDRTTGPRHRRTRQRAKVRLADVAVDAVTQRQCVERILVQIDQHRGGVVITPNMDHLRRCSRDPEYATMLRAADLVVADGMPLVWASKIQGTPLPERVAGSDLISSLTAAATEHGRSVFLLGGDPGTAEASAEVLRQRNPSLKLAGIYCPPIGFENDAEIMPDLLEALRSSSPDIVYVGLGSPKQEKLISVLRDKFPYTWWLGVGYSFSFLSGQASRAPLWMQKRGLEWLHRLLQDPRRLARRYLVDNLPFAASLMGGAVMKGISHRLAVTDESADAALSPTNVDLPRPVVEETIIYQSFLSDSLIRSVKGRIASIQSRRQTPLLEVQRLVRLRGVMLLGGSVMPTPLTSAIGRSILDLPMYDGRSLLTHWHRQVRDLRRAVDIDQLPLMVLLDQNSTIPMPPPRRTHVPIRIQRDRMAYRGTGGVLHDLAADFADEDYLLVASAAQSLIRPLPDLADLLAGKQADISFIAPTDGTPSGMMLMKCAALRRIAAAGYVDFKEQALPILARHFDVVPVVQSLATALPVRTLSEYLAAVQYQHLTTTAGDDDRSSSFSVTEKGAVVHPSARLHDAVVLRNARVDADAVVVRSIVCPGGVILRNATALDEVVMKLGAA